MKKKGRMTALLSAAVMLAAQAQPVPAAQAADAPFDYAKALQMSLYFYECQQAGKLPEWNRVEWRGDAVVNDDVDGGWFDAGDHVKFNLPMSYSAAMIAWGLYEYPDGVEKSGEMQNYVNNLEWVLDYFVRCDLGDKVVYQVGNGQNDHTWWGPAEMLEYGMKDQNITTPRGHLEGRDCTAVTAEMAAALTAGYCALEGRISETKRADYLKHAKNLFKMADADRSDDTYQASDPAMGGFYSSSHFYDELFWCANWLYIATKDKSYLDLCKDYIPNLGTELGQGDTLKYSWCQCWDDVQQGGTLLYALNTGDEKWIAQTKKHLEYWRTSKDVVPGGLIYVQNWGCLRHANAFAFLCSVANDRLFHEDAYAKLAETQCNYALGGNPNKQCYVVGYAENSPKRAHHRTAHGSWKNALKVPDDNRHILYGALAGGPNQDGSYNDDRQDFINNEVATDYNSGFTAMLCKMLDVYGGKSDPDFPYPETRDDELFVEAKATSDAGGTTVSMKITNHTAWPARVVDNVSMRYFFDASEIIAAGCKPEDVVLRCDRDQSEMYSADGVKTAVISKPKQYKGDIYYIEITFPDGRAFIPISDGQNQCEILLAIVCPDYQKFWNAKNDYSIDGIEGSKDNVKTAKIPVYENGVLVYGEEPDGTKGAGSPSARQPYNGSNPVIVDKTEPRETEAPTDTTETTEEYTGDPLSPPPTKDKLGDVDCDGSVTVADAVMLARFIAEDKEVNVKAQGLRNAHCFADDGNSINADDLVAILEVLANIIQETDLPKKP